MQLPIFDISTLSMVGIERAALATTPPAVDLVGPPRIPGNGQGVRRRPSPASPVSQPRAGKKHETIHTRQPQGNRWVL
jgi:hypothetical protein